jgi:hypothetical protein
MRSAAGRMPAWFLGGLLATIRGGTPADEWPGGVASRRHVLSLPPRCRRKQSI